MIPVRVEPPAARRSAHGDGGGLRDALRDALSKNFASMDKNGDGALNLSEFRQGLGMLGMDADFSAILFNMFEKNADGNIDRREFLASMGVMLHPDSIELQIGLAFDAYDLNKDGKLDLSELTNVVKAMHSAIAKMGISDVGGDPEQIAGELYDQMDYEKKGYITKSDYLKLASTNPELIKKIGLDTSNVIGRRSQRRKSAINPPRSAEQRRRSRRKKRGTTVTFGHQNWEQVIQMMLGIRLAVGQALQTAREGGASGSDDVAFRHVNRPLASELYFESWKTHIPTNHGSGDSAIPFKDYAPQVFRRIRHIFGVSDREYMLSLGPEQILGELLLGTLGSMSELFSEGKSGSFFYFSNDGNYLIKTIPHRELISLLHILPDYVEYVSKQPHTVLPRFMSAHRLYLHGTGKVHFVVMANVFSTDRVIHERYDLKGSTLGRSAGAANIAEHPDVVRKDKDLQAPFRVSPEVKVLLTTQLKSDIAFLRRVRTMDYSLLCGINYPARDDPAFGDGCTPGSPGAGVAAARLSSLLNTDNSVSDQSLPVLLESAASNYDESVGSDAEGGDCADSDTSAVTPSGNPMTPSREVNPPSRDSTQSMSQVTFAVDGRAHRNRTESGSLNNARRNISPWSDDGDGGFNGVVAEGEEPVRYYIGIIDILTSWSTAKSAENFTKTLTHPLHPNSISCIPPRAYADRFAKAMKKWII